MKIVLVGYMGSGKSLIGKELAEFLNLNFYDLDNEIELENKQSVTEIFKSKGEIFFRKSENQLLTNFLEKENFVLSVGGGTPMYFDNMNLITQNSLSMYLRADLQTLTDRLYQEKDKRPLISHIETKEMLKEFIAKHIFERKIQYEKSSVIIDVTSKKVEDIVKEIVLKIKK